MRYEVERAESFYAQAAYLEHWLEPEGRRIFSTMMATYRALLSEIKRRDGDVLTSRVRLSWWHKMRITGRGLVMPLAPLPALPMEVVSQ
jgi:phytoene synthase